MLATVFVGPQSYEHSSEANSTTAENQAVLDDQADPPAASTEEEDPYYDGGSDPANAPDDGVDKDPTAEQKKIAEAIGRGHAWTDHGSQFPDIKNQNDFVKEVGRVIANPTVKKKLRNGREAFYDRSHNIIVV